MGTCEAPNPPRFAFSRLGPALQHLLWLVRGRNCGRQHGISSIFPACCLFDTLRVEESTDLSQNRHTGDAARCQRQAIAVKERITCNSFPAHSVRLRARRYAQAAECADPLMLIMVCSIP